MLLEFRFSEKVGTLCLCYLYICSVFNVLVIFIHITIYHCCKSRIQMFEIVNNTRS